MGSPRHLSVVPNVPKRPLDNSLASVVTALTELPEWRKVLAMNDLSRRIVFRSEPPYREGAMTGRPLSEQDFDRIRLWFEDSRKVSFSKRNLVEGARIVATWNAFHPVREYLEALVWDGTPRVESWLEDFCAVTPTSEPHRALLRAVSRKWLTSCVARALQPGCKVDTMLILEGAQGIGKSTALRTLAGPGFFSDSAIDFSANDGCRSVQGVWIQEIPELGALLRGNLAHAKAFLSSATDYFRTPYSRTPEAVPRSMVFCGTVNHAGYLRDTTGNRRFWVVRCDGPIQREALEAARDALWAEARQRFLAGESWHLTPEEEAFMEGEHEERLEVDPWEESIAAWCDRSGRDGDGAQFTMVELLDGALGMRLAARSPNVTSRVGAILDRMGYERRRSTSGLRGYVYRRRVGGG